MREHLDDHTRHLHDEMTRRVANFYRVVRIGRWVAFGFGALFVAWVIWRVM